MSRRVRRTLARLVRSRRTTTWWWRWRKKQVSFAPGRLLAASGLNGCCACVGRITRCICRGQVPSYGPVSSFASLDPLSMRHEAEAIVPPVETSRRRAPFLSWVEVQWCDTAGQGGDYSSHSGRSPAIRTNVGLCGQGAEQCSWRVHRPLDDRRMLNRRWLLARHLGCPVDPGWPNCQDCATGGEAPDDSEFGSRAWFCAGWAAFV